MSEREQFITAMQPMPCNYDDRTQKFTDAGVNLAWFAWQASRRAALEQAAAHFEGIAAKQGHLPITPEFAARQVRTLAKETNNG